MPKITKRIVDSATPDPTGREVMVWDTELRGFGFRIQPSGTKTYFCFYRTAEGRQRKIAIGRVGTLTPDEARALARQHLAEVAKGGDPSAERQSLRQSITVAELCDAYLADAASRIKPSTLTMDRSRIDRHVKPLIGARRVTALRDADIERMRDDIIAGRTAAPREGRGGATTGGKGVAARTVGMVGAILEFARRKKIIRENPARGIARPPDGKQTRFLSRDEIATLGQAIRDSLAEGAGAVPMAAITFLLLSGCRRMEALTLREADIDRAAGCIRFGDTKTGAQIRPIGASAIAALETVPSRGGWVFPSAKGAGHFVGLPSALDRLCERAGLDGVTLHVLRHSFAATAAGMGFTELTIAGLLGHSMPGVTARYAHVPDAALVIAADRISAEIAAALAGEKP